MILYYFEDEKSSGLNFEDKIKFPTNNKNTNQNNKPKTPWFKIIYWVGMTLYFFTVFVFLLGVISFITQFFLTQFFLSDFGKMFPFAKSYVEYIPIMITTSLLGFCVLTAFAFFKKYFLTKIDTNSRNGIKKRVFERLETLRKEANFLETILKFSDLTKEEKTFYSQKLSLTNSRFKTLLDEYYQHFKDKK